MPSGGLRGRCGRSFAFQWRRASATAEWQRHAPAAAVASLLLQLLQLLKSEARRRIQLSLLRLLLLLRLRLLICVRWCLLVRCPSSGCDLRLLLLHAPLPLQLSALLFSLPEGRFQASGG
jgi:hypothetical protein